MFTAGHEGWPVQLKAFVFQREVATAKGKAI